ncbi:LMBR1-like membrane protein [Aureococcus anophagefferens]|nr:LMBR1-like membrane protein [Aureococcus anophagefferens]
MAASSPYALGILNLFFLLVGIVVLTVVNVYVLVKWQHPGDKNQWVSAKAAVVLGMLVTELVIVGLPLDVANNGGARDCSYDWGDTAECGGLDMRAYWLSVFGLAIAWVWVVIPTYVFAYEAHDELGEHTTGDTFKAAACSELGLLVVFLIVVIPMYFIINEGLNSFEFMGDLASTDRVFSSRSSDTIVFGVNFLDYLAAFFSWVGWFLFALWGGIGLACLPIDLILAYVYRPVPMDAREIAEYKLQIQKRRGAHRRRRPAPGRASAPRGPAASSFLDGAKQGWWATRKQNARDQVKVNKFAQMVFILETEVEELEIISGRAKDYEPLVYVGYLLLGVVAAVHSLLWVVHIIVYMLVDPAPTPFLNDYLIQFSSWYPLFGSLACALFTFYLLCATMKGCLKFGTRFFLIKLHPMKYNGTYLNSFLFNVGLFGICAFPVVQFCTAAFADYARFSDAATRFIVVKHLVFFKSFYDTMAFEYALMSVLGLALVWLFIAPHDVPASTSKLKASLGKAKPRATSDARASSSKYTASLARAL